MPWPKKLLAPLYIYIYIYIYKHIVLLDSNIHKTKTFKETKL